MALCIGAFPHWRFEECRLRAAAGDDGEAAIPFGELRISGQIVPRRDAAAFSEAGYVADSPHPLRFDRVSPSYSVLYTFPSNVDNPEGLAVDPTGNVFAGGTIGSADIFTPNQVARITPTGSRSNYATVGPQENLSAAMDLLGNLCLSDLTHNGSLWRVSPTQQVTEVVSNLGFATGITTAPDGVSVLVSARFENKIWKVAPGGGLSVFANITDPWALAFDPAGNLLVGQGTQISRIAPNGSQSVFATVHDARGIANVPEPTGMILVSVALTSVLFRRQRVCRTA